MPKFNPRPYQIKIIAHMLAHPRCGVFAAMGTGKTSATLAYLEFLAHLSDQPLRALILAPLRVAASTWPQEVNKWRFALKISAVIGSPAQRLQALKQPADVYSCNYENLPWLYEAIQAHQLPPFNIIVADEATRLKNFRLGKGGKRTKFLAKMAWIEGCRFIALTGTPAPNGLLDLWGLTWFIDKGERLGKTYGSYTTSYFKARRVGASPFAVTYDPEPWAQGIIEGKISDICLSIRAEDYFTIDAPIVRQVTVDLPKSAKKVYAEIWRDMVTELQSGAIVDAVNAAARSVKCLQVASGVLYTGDSTWEILHDEKIKALESILEESAGEPVIVAYHWRSDLDRLLKAFPMGRVLDTNPETIADWNRGEIPILFAHPASAGHGLNLQDGGRIMVLFSPWWDLEQYQQIIERIGPVRQTQAGHPRAVYIYQITARNTLDSAVLQRLEQKATIQDALMNALKSEGLAE